MNVAILAHGQKYVGHVQQNPIRHKLICNRKKKKSEGGGVISSAIKSKTAITVLELPSCFKGKLTSSYPSK